MKAIWSGSLSFGLVNIAVKLYSAIAPENPGFTLLCDTCKTPITYQRWCQHCDKAVSWEHTVKGLRQPDGSFFILNQESLKKLRPEKSEFFKITEFIDAQLIHLIYFDSHYYAGPARKNEKEYFLFQQALAQSGKVAIGTFVMHEKEHVAAIFPYKNALLINTLNYAYEIKSLETIANLDSRQIVQKDELKLALQLIDQLTKKKFDISKFHNSFKEKLEAAIKASKKRTPGKKKIVKKTKRKPVREEKAIATALRASLKKPSRQPVAYAKGKK